MAYEEIKSSGVTGSTPDNIMLGAGTFHKGLKFSDGKWNFSESLIGATSGGGKVSIKPEILDIEADGALVKVEGLAVKTGETASMEISFIEITTDVLKIAAFAESKKSETVSGYTEIVSKKRIEEGDYIENLGFIGRTVSGKPIIIIFDMALCTSGVEMETKNKENVVMKCTFECYAKITGDLETLPYHIFYPEPEKQTTPEDDKEV